MASLVKPLRLFFDSGVIIEGCTSAWGASKALLIMATLRANYTVVLAASVEQEVSHAIARKSAGLDTKQSRDVAADFAGWLERIRIERYALPTPEQMQTATKNILPALRHINDLAAVITAMQAQPDWVISTNTAHWNDRLAARTGLPIVTPRAFLMRFHLA